MWGHFFAKWGLFFARVSYLVTAADTVPSTRRCCILRGPRASTAAGGGTAAAGSCAGHLCSHQYRHCLQRRGRLGPPASTCGYQTVQFQFHRQTHNTHVLEQQSNRTNNQIEPVGGFEPVVSSNNRIEPTIESNLCGGFNRPVMINIQIEPVGGLTCAGAGGAI